MGDLTSTKILVIEDCADTRRIIRHVLRHDGFRDIAEADSGEDALRMVSGSFYDVILCDWMLPMATGLEILSQVRSGFPNGSTPFIMVTSVDDERQVREAVNKGVTDYIVKPFSHKTLTDKLFKALGITPTTL